MKGFIYVFDKYVLTASYVLGPILSPLHVLSYTVFTAIYEVGIVVIILLMIKLRLKEVNLSKVKS